ncbi:MAG: histidinol-phosphate transaminase [Fimbriimonas sp.]
MPLPIRSNVLRMHPYSPGKPVSEVQREFGLDRVVKLASNENPLGPSPKAVRAVEEAAKQLHIYPDGSSYDLKQAIAHHYDLPANQIVVGNGSDELIHLLGLLFLGEANDEIMVGSPGFSRYWASAHLVPSRVVEVPLDADFRHDLTAMARAVSENTRMIFVANPHNPTGTIVRKNEVDRFLDDVPESVAVVLDEAYYEFADGVADFPVSTDYVRTRPNVIGLRTFSKTYGLAGIRIGFGFVPAEVSDAIDRAREPFNANSLAQVAAIAALGDDEHIRATVQSNTEGLGRIAAAFRACGATPTESFANFVWADLHRPARPVFQALLERGVITRCGDVFGHPTCLRVSVGTAEEIGIFVETLNQVLEEVR